MGFNSGFKGLMPYHISIVCDMTGRIGSDWSNSAKFRYNAQRLTALQRAYHSKALSFISQYFNQTETIICHVRI